MIETDFEGLTKQQQDLLDAADSAMEFAYNPYSHFYAGTAALTQSGETFVGANMFISSTGMSNCAETAALSAANAAGQRDVTTLAVIARSDDVVLVDPNTSCGRCRQVIFEFSQLSGNDIELIYANAAKDRVLITSIKEILPMPYISGSLRNFNTSE